MTNINITETISRNVNYFNIIFFNCTSFLRVLNFKNFFSVEVTVLPDLFQSYFKVHRFALNAGDSHWLLLSEGWIKYCHCVELPGK